MVDSGQQVTGAGMTSRRVSTSPFVMRKNVWTTSDAAKAEIRFVDGGLNI